MSGYFAEFKSNYNGAPIWLVFNGFTGSRNEKTGNMIQTFIVDASEVPASAVKSGADASVCGGCKRRRGMGELRDCYVIPHQAPTSVYLAKLNGSYQPLNLADKRQLRKFKGRQVRLGSYGDPAAVPLDFWREFFAKVGAEGHTGYTHAWAEPFAQGYRDFLMASVDSPEEFHRARGLGWRTFRAFDDPRAPLFPREFICPATPLGGGELTCEDCGACDGAARGVDRASVAVLSHGWISYSRRKKAKLTLAGEGPKRSQAHRGRRSFQA